MKIGQKVSEIEVTFSNPDISITSKHGQFSSLSEARQEAFKVAGSKSEDAVIIKEKGKFNVYGIDEVRDKFGGLWSDNKIVGAAQGTYQFVITDPEDGKTVKIAGTGDNSSEIDKLAEKLTGAGMSDRDAYELIKAGFESSEINKISKNKFLKYAGFNANFPESWLKDPVNGKFEKLSDKQSFSDSLEVTEKSLVKYPEKLLKKDLDKIYFSKSLNFNGAAFGGTNDNRNVYMAYLIEGSFHHEFSSILLRNYPNKFDKAAWEKIGTLPYNDVNGFEAIKEGRAGTDMDENFMQKGYLDQYSTSTMENDLNQFAKAILSGDKKFWEAVDKFPKIKQKFDLFVDFYQKVDPTFTKEYFKSLAK
jgi:hypothetical protein